jgi:hypothetical protein
MAAAPNSRTFRISTAFNDEFKAGISRHWDWETFFMAVAPSTCSSRTSTSSSCSYTYTARVLIVGIRMADSKKEREGQEI